MLKIVSYIVPFVLAGSLVGCASEDPSGPGDMGAPDASVGSGSNQPAPPVCGDHVCSGSETTATCATDCPADVVCGDDYCSGNETLYTCAQDCSTCGDGICYGDETASSCAADCSTPPTTCTTSPDDCTNDTVCVSGTCVPAVGRVYKLYIASGTVPEKTSSNASWDPLGGLPDPYVNVFLNGALALSTSEKDNTLSPAWNEGAVITVAAGARLQLDVYDDDLDAVDGSMFSCFNVALDAPTLRKHGNGYVDTCYGPSSSTEAIRFYFVPQ